MRRWLSRAAARWRAHIDAAPPWDATRSLTAPAVRAPRRRPDVLADADDGYYRDELLALSAERSALMGHHHRHRTYEVRQTDAAIDRILDAWWQSRRDRR